MVMDAGGRLCLSKDSYTDIATFRSMYPEVDEWLATKAKYDPDGVSIPNQAQRVGLC